MEILVLGSADMNSRFFSASYLINGKILVDIPGGACRELLKRGVEPVSVDAVLITHLHGDHVLGLPVWTLQKTKATRPEEGRIRISVNENGRPWLESLVRNSFSTSLTEEKTGGFFRWIAEDDFTLGELRVRRIPVEHGSLPDCFGYLVTDGSVTVGFTGDSRFCGGVETLAASADFLFCDCDLIAGNDKHMGIDDLLSLSKEFPGTRIVAVHMKDETRRELLRVKPKGISAASDGERFCV